MEICDFDKQGGGSVTGLGAADSYAHWRSEIHAFCTHMCAELESIERQLGDERHSAQPAADERVERRPFPESSDAASTDERLAVLRRQLTRWIENSDELDQAEGHRASRPSLDEPGANDGVVDS